MPRKEIGCSKSVEAMSVMVDKHGPVAALQSIRAIITMNIDSSAEELEIDERKGLVTARQKAEFKRLANKFFAIERTLNDVQRQLIEMGLGEDDDWQP